MKINKFKGTKGKWKLATNEYVYYTYVRNLDDTIKICASRVNNMTESNANMLLISKAPEMLKELMKEVEILKAMGLGDTERCKRKEQLIKEATEL